MVTNRQWLLSRRPQGPMQESDFTYRELPAPTAAQLAPGEVHVRNSLFLCAPTMRNWMEPPGNSLYPSIPLGSSVMAPAGGRVIASARPGINEGAMVTYFGHWQDYEIIQADAQLTPVPVELNLQQAMGSVGLNARTAYFGLTQIGRPKPGETLLVSGAAGSTGAVAMQIGRILGCRTIGIAGTDEKCHWLVDQCGAVGAINYRSGNVDSELARLCPEGVNIFFDNVGGDILCSAIKAMARFGRIVLCGQIASYDGDIAKPLCIDMMRLIYGSITMQGFLQADFATQEAEAIAQLQEWIAAGELLTREDVREGFENLPTVFTELFSGGNEGTLLVRIS